MIASNSPSRQREDEESLLASPTATTTTGSGGILDMSKSAARSISLRSMLLSTLAFMKPSFLHRTDTMSEKDPKPPSYSETAYLDGVRGVASLIVFNLHWIHNPYPQVNAGWGYKYDSWLLLPYIRLIYSGAAMVSVFFVVSGFVLSHRFIQRMQRGEHAELASGLTSLTFRRAIRLFLPAFASSFMAYLASSLGLVKVPETDNGKPFTHGPAAYLEFLDLESNPWDWNAEFFGYYNPQLWSIAVEFRGSMVVFLLLLGLSKTRAGVRIAVEGFLTWHAFYHRRWDVALFIAGMLLAELVVLFPTSKQNNNNGSSNSAHQQQQQQKHPKLFKAFLIITFIVGCFFLGYPRDDNHHTPFYMWSKQVWPYTAYRRRFWLAIGAILTVGPMAFLPGIQKVFLTRPARYLGKISFALYLVHGLGNRTVGTWLLLGAFRWFGYHESTPYAISFAVASLFYYPFVIWSADMFWRACDVPSTNFARWFEKKCQATPVVSRDNALRA